MGISQPLGGLTNPLHSDASPPKSPRAKRGLASIISLLFLVSLLGNLYLVGLLRNTPNSFAQLRQGSTTTHPGTVTKLTKSRITVKGESGTKSIALTKDTAFALFPKNYQTLIPVGLPSSRDDAVVGSTEASVSAQQAYLSAPKALRVNLVRDDMLTGKVIEVKDNSVTFKAFAAEGFKEQTLKFAPTITYLKLGADGTLTAIQQADIAKDMGLYAYLDKPAGPDDALIVKVVVADFTAN